MLALSQHPAPSAAASRLRGLSGDLLADPRTLFRVSVPPARCVTSLGSGWDGALLVDVTTAPAGGYHQDHELLVVQRWSSPLCLQDDGSADGWTTLRPGAMLRFPGDGQHGRWRGTSACQLLFVTPARVAAVLGTGWEESGLLRWREPTFGPSFVGEVLSALARDVEDGYPAGPVTGDTLVVALLSHLDRRGAAPGSPGPRALGRRVAHVLEYIDANLARSLTLAELATVACVRVRRLTDLFTAATGHPPHRYIVHRRIERAKLLMRDPEVSLAQVAQAVGFSGPSQLSRVFRQWTGQSPSAFRGR